MTAPPIRRLVASVAVVALLLGTAPVAPRGTARCHCAAECPMHRHGARLPCHGGGVGLRGTCGHGADATAPAAGVRVALAAPVASRPAFTAQPLTTAGAPEHAAPVGEPPTDPPRASFA
ncbi:MAG TPA: hypothetical protein VKW76_09700 [Candidatus Binatia bacterium]|nr:hypothetical protein [Candidatus Binatia bacterium]